MLIEKLRDEMPFHIYEYVVHSLYYDYTAEQMEDYLAILEKPEEISARGFVYSQDGEELQKLYALRGTIKKNKKQYEQAIADYNLVIDKEPANIIILINRAQCYLAIGNREAAKQDIYIAMEQLPNSTRPFSMPEYLHGFLVDRLMEEGAFSAAWETVEKALALYPNAGELLYRRGLLSAHKEDYDAAIKDYDAAISKGMMRRSEAMRARLLARRALNQTIEEEEKAIRVLERMETAVYKLLGDKWAKETKEALEIKQPIKENIQKYQTKIEPTPQTASTPNPDSSLPFDDPTTYIKGIKISDDVIIWLNTRENTITFPDGKVMQLSEKDVEGFNQLFNDSGKAETFQGFPPISPASSMVGKNVSLSHTPGLHNTFQKLADENNISLDNPDDNKDLASITTGGGHKLGDGVRMQGNFVSFDDPKSAIKFFTKSIQSEPNNPIYHFSRGDMYLLVGNYNAALTDFNKAIELKHPDKGMCHFKAGEAYRNMLKFIDALREYDIAEQYLVAPFEEFYFNRALTRMVSATNDRAALEDCHKLISLNPNSSKNYSARAQIYDLLGDKEKARADYKRATELELRGK